ncbi:aminobenzoyl-glutamate utilization protein A [Synergistales bacterium]|nr:aminobenzoyl-glutamate utilization protein A [Synergistales bacterium]
MDWKNLERELIALRRDFHKYPESAWTEFRASAIIASRLGELGYKLSLGFDNIDVQSVMGRPDEAEIDRQIERSKAQLPKTCADGAGLIDKMRRYPGVVGILDSGKKGPVISLRFDIDCVDVNETDKSEHRPNKEGFASVNACLDHSCGHDAHAAIGLGLATALMERKDELRGEIRLIFQPGEEGCRGAYAMTQKGVVDGSDYFLSMHIGTGVPSGSFGLNSHGHLCTTKFDAVFTGRAAHAAGAPQEGKNALLAAATAAISLHAIAPHSDGPMRVNVGTLHAGTGRNVIADHAVMKAETRGENQKIADYVYKRACEVISGAAAIYETEVKITKEGSGTSADGDVALAEKVGAVLRASGLFSSVLNDVPAAGSEDATWMMRRVQEQGGQALYMALGSDITAPHHNGAFDLDESAMINGVRALDAIVGELSKSEGKS